MKKKIAIELDFGLRNWYSSLILTYIKQVDDWEGDLTGVPPSELWNHFKFPQYIEVIKTMDENGHDYDGYVETLYVVDESKELEINKKLFNDFVLSNVLEIFGHAIESQPNIISYYNEIQRSNPDIELTLVSEVKGKAKPATLFFLSKYGCEINQILFVDNIEDLKGFDLILCNESVKNKELDFKNL